MAFVPLKRKVVEEKEEDNDSESAFLSDFMPLCCSTLDLGCGGGNTPGSCSHSFAHKGMSSATRCSHCTSGFAIFPNSRSYRWHVESWLFILKIPFFFCSQRKGSCVTEDVAFAPLKLAQKSQESHPSERECSFVLLPCGLGTHLCLVAGPGAKYEVSRDRFWRGNLLSRRIEEGLKAVIALQLWLFLGQSSLS